MKVWEVTKQKGQDVHTIGPSETVADAIKHFVQHKVRALVVAENGRVAGMLTIRDILSHFAAQGAAALDAKVTEAMTRDVTSVGPETLLQDVERLFAEKQINHVPVLEDGKLVGLLTPADVFASHLRVGASHS